MNSLKITRYIIVLAFQFLFQYSDFCQHCIRDISSYSHHQLELILIGESYRTNSGLDPKTSLVIDDLLHSITQEFNMTTIINTHDMNSVMGIGENIIFIYEGHKEWQGVSSEIMNSTNKRLTDFIFASDLLKEMREAVTGQKA